MAIIDNDAERLKVTDTDGDSLMVHEVERDGGVIITCHNGANDEYATALLTNEERLLLIERLTVGAKPAPEWIIELNEDDEYQTRCPHCQAVNTIAEHDTAVRWNTLRLHDDGCSATASLDGSGDWESDGWICAECLSTALDAPEGFEILNWY